MHEGVGSGLSEGRLNPRCDRTGGQDEGEAGERVDHGGFPAAHLDGIAAGAHVQVSPPHDEKRRNDDPDGRTNIEEIREEVGDCGLCVHWSILSWR